MSRMRSFGSCDSAHSFGPSAPAATPMRRGTSGSPPYCGSFPGAIDAAMLDAYLAGTAQLMSDTRTPSTRSMRRSGCDTVFAELEDPFERQHQQVVIEAALAGACATPAELVHAPKKRPTTDRRRDDERSNSDSGFEADNEEDGGTALFCCASSDSDCGDVATATSCAPNVAPNGKPPITNAQFELVVDMSRLSLANSPVKKELFPADDGGTGSCARGVLASHVLGNNGRVCAGAKRGCAGSSSDCRSIPERHVGGVPPERANRAPYAAITSVADATFAGAPRLQFDPASLPQRQQRPGASDFATESSVAMTRDKGESPFQKRKRFGAGY